jgi:adenylate cyclase
MATEIERKFLVQGTQWQAGSHATGVRICQGYLNRDKERTVRVRIKGDHSFLTIKGISKGASRAEFEYEIPVADAEQLLKLSDGPIIEKNRYVVVHDGSKWEIDEFLGDNSGLLLAEIELKSEDEAFSRPPWLGAEVTHDTRYYNSSLAGCPYGKWRDQA